MKSFDTQCGGGEERVGATDQERVGSAVCASAWGCDRTKKKKEFPFCAVKQGVRSFGDIFEHDLLVLELKLFSKVLH